MACQLHTSFAWTRHAHHLLLLLHVVVL